MIRENGSQNKSLELIFLQRQRTYRNNFPIICNEKIIIPTIRLTFRITSHTQSTIPPTNKFALQLPARNRKAQRSSNHETKFTGILHQTPSPNEATLGSSAPACNYTRIPVLYGPPDNCSLLYYSASSRPPPSSLSLFLP